MSMLNYGAFGKAKFPKGLTPFDPLIGQYESSLTGLLSPKAIRATANQQVQAQLNKALGGIRAGYQLPQKQLTDLQNRARGFALAIQRGQQQTGQAAAAPYTAAAEAIKQLGTGLTGDVARTWEEAAAKSAADVAGLTGGLGKVQGYDPAAIRNVAQVTGVAMPAADLYSQAARAVASGRMQNQAAVEQVRGVEQEWGQRLSDLITQRSAELGAARAQRPELFQAALATGQQGRQTAMSNLANLLGARATYGLNERQLAEAVRAAKASEATDRARIKALAQATGMDEAQLTGLWKGQPIKGYVKDPKTGSVVPYGDWVAANTPAGAPTANFQLSDRYGFLVDDSGVPILQGGKMIALPPAPGEKTKAKPMTLKDKVAFTSQIAADVKKMATGWTDEDGTKHPPIPAEEAWQWVESAGYMDKRLLPIVIAELKKAYPGQRNLVALGVVAGPAKPAGLGPTPTTEQAGGGEPSGRTWNPYNDPIVARGLPGGVSRTTSGNFVNEKTGKYVKGPK